jgi:hypothetical protein
VSITNPGFIRVRHGLDNLLLLQSFNFNQSIKRLRAAILAEAYTVGLYDIDYQEQALVFGIESPEATTIQKLRSCTAGILTSRAL